MTVVTVEGGVRLCIADKMTAHYVKNELKLPRRLRLGLRAVIVYGELA